MYLNFILEIQSYSSLEKYILIYLFIQSIFLIKNQYFSIYNKYKKEEINHVVNGS